MNYFINAFQISVYYFLYSLSKQLKRAILVVSILSFETHVNGLDALTNSAANEKELRLP